MNHGWTCPQCGGNSYHFSSSRGCMVCDTCGTEMWSEAERNEDLNYQKNMALARQHLKVGNWNEAKRLVLPYANSRPTDKQVYLILLAAVTKCYDDFLIEDPNARTEAAQYWEKLERLGCVNSAMVRYSQRRTDKVKALRTVIEGKRTAAIALDVIMVLVTLGLIMGGEGIAILFIILTAVVLTQTNKWLKKNRVDHLE